MGKPSIREGVFSGIFLCTGTSLRFLLFWHGFEKHFWGTAKHLGKRCHLLILVLLLPISIWIVNPAFIGILGSGYVQGKRAGGRYQRPLNCNEEAQSCAFFADISFL